MKKPIVIGPVWYGIPEKPLEIRGFEVVARADEWLTAKQGDKEFAIAGNPERLCLQLWPWEKRADGSRCVRTDRAITIPLEMTNQ